MENLLFDLYVAQVEIEENIYVFRNDSAKKQDLLNSVFKKHKIKEQTFDTSLVWYNRNLDKYLKINKRIEDRFAILADTLNNQITAIEEARRLAERFNLLSEPFSFFLQSPGRFQHIYPFQTDATQLKNNRSFELEFDLLGVSTTDSTHLPILVFCMQCSDTTFVNRDTLKVNGHYFKVFSIPQKNSLKKIYGSFYIPDTEKQFLFFNHLFLTKQTQSTDPFYKPQIAR